MLSGSRDWKITSIFVTVFGCPDRLFRMRLKEDYGHRNLK
jgi:hypothetical protein